LGVAHKIGHKICNIAAAKLAIGIGIAAKKPALAILGNVGTLISFCLGSEDAEIIARELFPVFTEEHLQNLPSYNSYLKLSIGSSTSEPFSAATLPTQRHQEILNAAKVLEQTRQRYSTPKTLVKNRIGRWLQ